MNEPKAGMAVFAVNGRRIGEVREVREACFEVAREKRAGGDICLLRDALFTVEEREGVSLVCSREEVERYRCGEHLA